MRDVGTEQVYGIVNPYSTTPFPLGVPTKNWGFTKTCCTSNLHFFKFIFVEMGVLDAFLCGVQRDEKFRVLLQVSSSGGLGLINK